MTADEIVAAIAAHVSENPEHARSLARAIRDHDDAKPLATVLINAGAAKKKGQDSESLKQAKDAAAALEEKVAELETQLEAAKGEPDKRVADLQRQLDKATKAAEAAQKQVEMERGNRKGDLVGISRARFRSALQGRVDDFGLDALERRFGERFKPRDDLSGVDVLDDEGEPIEPPKGKTAEEMLAEIAFQAVPAANRQRQMNPGGGAGNYGGPSAPTIEQLQVEKAQTGAYSAL